MLDGAIPRAGLLLLLGQRLCRRCRCRIHPRRGGSIHRRGIRGSIHHRGGIHRGGIHHRGGICCIRRCSNIREAHGGYKDAVGCYEENKLSRRRAEHAAMATREI